jgi:hypothetical protein
VASVAGAGDWEWGAAPYLWAADTGLDVAVANEPVIGADVAFSDVLDKIDLAGAVHFEGRRGKVGVLVDLFYLTLSDDRTTAAEPPLPGGSSLEAGMDLGIYEAAGFWRPGGGSHGFDLLAGVRVLDQEQEVRVALPAPSTTATTVESAESHVDGLIGGRYSRELGARWEIGLGADASSGDTELTWSASAGLGVRFGEKRRNVLRFGWRHFDSETEGETKGGQDIDSELTLSGPIVGFVFGF